MVFKVLSEQVAHALDRTDRDDVSETVKFVRYMDKFFDCLKVTNFNTGYHKRESVFRTHILLKMIFV